MENKRFLNIVYETFPKASLVLFKEFSHFCIFAFSDFELKGLSLQFFLN